MTSSKSAIALLIGILVPSILFLVFVIVVCIRRYQHRGLPVDYSLVEHELDEEEIEFRNRNESKYANMKQDDTLDIADEYYEGGEEFEEYEFDHKDMDRLSMLERFRNNLVASTGGTLNGNSNNTGGSSNSVANNNGNHDMDQKDSLLANKDSSSLEYCV